MTEKLLQYIWNYKIFKNFNFLDLEGNPIEIIDFGTWNPNSGPDFLNAKIKTKNLVFAGNIELHLRSSDWQKHHHSGNNEYSNVILHCVFYHDFVITELEEKSIPTLELKAYIDKKTLSRYNLIMQETNFIPCEKIFDSEAIPFHFCEETLLKKLDEKSIAIEASLQNHQNNYEAILFHQLAYVFGLKVNAPIFKEIAENIDFGILQKIRQNQTQLESLFFGKAGWLNNPLDKETKIWENEFSFLEKKFNLSKMIFAPKFLRLRPANFPTIRLSQLANLYHRENHLFSKIIAAKTIQELYEIFLNIKASEYWNCRFTFGKATEKSTEKFLTKSFVDIIIINAILPIKYTYYKNYSEDIIAQVFDLYKEMASEKNSIISKWQNLGIRIQNALQSQSFLYHYKNKCCEKKCLNCDIGLQLLKL